MDAAGWDARYAFDEPVRPAEPNRWLVETLADLPPGTAPDLGAGEGRNAQWLARRGWNVTAVDFSTEAIRKGQATQAADPPEAAPRIACVQADLRSYVPAPRSGSAVVTSTCPHRPSARTCGPPPIRWRSAAFCLSSGMTGQVRPRASPVRPAPRRCSPPTTSCPASPAWPLEIWRAEHLGRRVGADGRFALDAVVEVVRTA